jgi:hypothetical protein
MGKNNRNNRKIIKIINLGINHSKQCIIKTNNENNRKQNNRNNDKIIAIIKIINKEIIMNIKRKKMMLTIVRSL